MFEEDGLTKGVQGLAGDSSENASLAKDGNTSHAWDWSPRRKRSLNRRKTTLEYTDGFTNKQPSAEECKINISSNRPTSLFTNSCSSCTSSHSDISSESGSRRLSDLESYMTASSGSDDFDTFSELVNNEGTGCHTSCSDMGHMSISLSLNAQPTLPRPLRKLETSASMPDLRNPVGLCEDTLSLSLQIDTHLDGLESIDMDQEDGARLMEDDSLSSKSTISYSDLDQTYSSIGSLSSYTLNQSSFMSFSCSDKSERSFSPVQPDTSETPKEVSVKELCQPVRSPVLWKDDNGQNDTFEATQVTLDTRVSHLQIPQKDSIYSKFARCSLSSYRSEASLGKSSISTWYPRSAGTTAFPAQEAPISPITKPPSRSTTSSKIQTDCQEETEEFDKTYEKVPDKDKIIEGFELNSGDAPLVEDYDIHPEQFLKKYYGSTLSEEEKTKLLESTTYAYETLQKELKSKKTQQSWIGMSLIITENIRVVARENRKEYIKSAVKALQKLTFAGNKYAQYHLATLYISGIAYSKDNYLLKPNATKAFNLYTSSAKQNHSEALFHVGLCYEHGIGVQKSKIRALVNYKKAAMFNHPGAMFRLGMCLLRGELRQAKQLRHGVKWLKLAAKYSTEKYPQALFQLAMLHDRGLPNVIWTDHPYLVQLLSRAASLNHVPSQYLLGETYEYGNYGASPDPGKSVYYYSLAAANGSRDAMFELGGWYLTGVHDSKTNFHFPQSETQALDWVKLSAISSLPRGMYTLGYFYELGIGCDPNLEKSRYWYSAAARCGDSRAKERFEKALQEPVLLRKDRERVGNAVIRNSLFSRAYRPNPVEIMQSTVSNKITDVSSSINVRESIEESSSGYLASNPSLAEQDPKFTPVNQDTLNKKKKNAFQMFTPPQNTSSPPLTEAGISDFSNSIKLFNDPATTINKSSTSINTEIRADSRYKSNVQSNNSNPLISPKSNCTKELNTTPSISLKGNPSEKINDDFIISTEEEIRLSEKLTNPIRKSAHILRASGEKRRTQACKVS